MTFRLCSAQEVTGFIGPLNGGSDTTRVRTTVNRMPLPAGTHTVYWDGLDDNGNVAHPPPGDALISGFWRYSLPDNAIFVTGARPHITAISSTPNYFSPLSNSFLADDKTIRVSYTVSENVSRVELRVINVRSKETARVLTMSNVPAGANSIVWDVKNERDGFIPEGDYQLLLIATDMEGNSSMLTAVTLIRLAY